MKKAFNPLMMSSTQELLGKYEQLNTKAAAFETANGESILVYYNPNCTFDLKKRGFTGYNHICALILYMI